MIYIAHRGNINGPNSRENDPSYIKEALFFKYDVEIDVWRKGKWWFLGHDKPEYPVEEDFLLNRRLWCHAKNLEALVELRNIHAHCFWHQNDDYTLTSRGYIWVYPGKPLAKNCVAVLPDGIYNNDELFYCYAICGDNVARYREYCENRSSTNV